MEQQNRFMKIVQQVVRARHYLWPIFRRLAVVSIGSVIAALGYSIFQVPFNIAAGGLSGIAIIVNVFTGWPIGFLYLLLNLPILVLGYFHLGRWQFLLYTPVSVFIFSVATGLMTLYVPTVIEPYPLTSDVLLSAIYGGLIGGIGFGLVYRVGGSPGGTGTLNQIIQKKSGIPLSQLYFYTDGVIILLAGAFFGWEIALHSLLSLFLSGIASDYTIEGPSVVRTATIVTRNPEALSSALMHGLQRSVSSWSVVGGYTGQPYSMIMCTVLRSQVSEMKQIISSVDPESFVVIGNAHQALGSGFLKHRRE